MNPAMLKKYIIYGMILLSNSGYISKISCHILM